MGANYAETIFQRWLAIRLDQQIEIFGGAIENWIDERGYRKLRLKRLGNVSHFG